MPIKNQTVISNSIRQNEYEKHNPSVYNPYEAINPSNLSDVALCYRDNPIQDCVHFTPAERIQGMSSSVFHGQHGKDIHFIRAANSFQNHSSSAVESFRENCACAASASIVREQPSFDSAEYKRRRKMLQNLPTK